MITRILPIIALAAVIASGQTTTYRQEYDYLIGEIVKAQRPRIDTIKIQERVSLVGELLPFLKFAQARAQATDFSFLPIEDARMDKQIGSTPGAAGTTSLVSKGAVPAFFGFAVENGALSESVSGTTATLRGNLIGWLDLVQKQGFVESYQDDSVFVRAMRRVSYSLSLDTARGTITNSSSRPSLDSVRQQIRQTSQQLSTWSVRLALWDERDPRTRANQALIGSSLEKSAVAALRSDNFLDAFLNSPEYDEWEHKTVELLSAPSLSRRQTERILYTQLEEVRLLAIRQVPDFNKKIEGVISAFQNFDSARLKLFQAINKKPVFAFEYVNKRLVTLPDLSTYRFIFDAPSLGDRLSLTANLAWTIQNNGTVLTPTPKTLGGRTDFQVAAQGDYRLGRLERLVSLAGGVGNPLLTFAYLSRQLTEKTAVSFAGYNFDVEPGWIHVGQVKFTIPIKNSGIKIPLSISLANRTELIREKEVRANIGITFDLDALAGGLLKK